MGIWATRRRTVIKAVAICGDEVKLAQHLGVPVSRVVDLILGNETATADEFLVLVDLVLDDQRKTIETHRDWIEHIRQRYATR